MLWDGDRVARMGSAPSRVALSINGKRSGIEGDDFKGLSKRFTIRRSGEIINQILNSMPVLHHEMRALDLPKRTREAVMASVGIKG